MFENEKVRKVEGSKKKNSNEIKMIYVLIIKN